MGVACKAYYGRGFRLIIIIHYFYRHHMAAAEDGAEEKDEGKGFTFSSLVREGLVCVFFY